MAFDPNIRASDNDRDRVASLLREHHAAGRLSAQEFSERLDRTFEAVTVGELDKLLADLPSIDLYRLPDAALTRRPRQAQPRRRGRGTGWRVAGGIWFTVSLLCFVIWVVTGAHGYVWPVWVAAPWGVVLAGAWVTTGVLRGGSGREIDQGRGPGQLPPADRDLPGRPGS
jgi:Domain of unknown function (DUF1707)